MNRRESFIVLAIYKTITRLTATTVDAFGIHRHAHYQSASALRDAKKWVARWDLRGWLGRPLTSSDSVLFSRAAESLDAKGLIERIRPWSQRMTHVYLTEAGRAAAEQLIAAEQDATPPTITTPAADAADNATDGATSDGTQAT